MELARVAERSVMAPPFSPAQQLAAQQESEEQAVVPCSAAVLPAQTALEEALWEQRAPPQASVHWDAALLPARYIPVPPPPQVQMVRATPPPE
jgi:hypothetical protein